MVETPEEADIVWYTWHYKQFKEFSEETPHKRINQFPFEHVLTIKVRFFFSVINLSYKVSRNGVKNHSAISSKFEVRRKENINKNTISQLMIYFD